MNIGYLGRFFQKIPLLNMLFHYDCCMPISIKIMPEYLINKGCPNCFSNCFVESKNMLYCGDCEREILFLDIKSKDGTDKKDETRI